jgi:hypothetical protein
MVERERFRRIEWKDRICTRCSQQAVDDEHHMLFECDKFLAARDQVWKLAMIPSDLSSSVMADFGDVRVCKFVSACMHEVDAEEVARRPLQAEQPTG